MAPVAGAIGGSPDQSRFGTVLFGHRYDGDFSDLDSIEVPDDVPPRPWTWLRQVHGSKVVTVTVPGEHAGEEADAAVTATPGCGLVVRTADCAPVALLAKGVGVGVVHAGWRGLEAGVLEASVAALRDLGAGEIRALVGPCIGPECYEFGEPELTRLTDRYGPQVRSTTTTGAPALDLRAGVVAALAAIAGVSVSADESPAPAADQPGGHGSWRCTACHPDHYFSYRARREAGRQGTLVWLS